METKIVNRGYGLSTVLTIVFLILKLTNVITWSWWWVFSPILISFGLSVLLLIFLGVIFLFAVFKSL